MCDICGSDDCLSTRCDCGKLTAECQGKCLQCGFVWSKHPVRETNKPMEPYEHICNLYQVRPAKISHGWLSQ